MISYHCLSILITVVCFVEALRPASNAIVSRSTASVNPASQIADTEELDQGVNNGFFYSFWTNKPGSAEYINDDAGTYSIKWDVYSGGWVRAGKGWNPGRERVITYNGTSIPDGDTLLGVYGWTRSPLVQYNIVDSFSYVDPSSVQGSIRRGTTFCNGANYSMTSITLQNYPSIDGVWTFPQFWSVRNPSRRPGGAISGEIDVACHFNAWKKVGMSIGSEHDYQILAIDGFWSRGSATITVS